MPRTLILCLGLTALLGCDAKIEQFEPNDVYAVALATSRQTPMETAVDDVAVVVEQLFGTPDQPRWPTEQLTTDSRRTLLDPDRLKRTAGPVFSERDGRHGGMFREHCVACHGLSGSGAGPTSRFQIPYPRDFRRGVFKWKQTGRTAKPTRADLMQVLHRGIPGTAMPSFAALDDDDLEALLDYLIYLSIRGEVERELLTAAVDELGYEGSRPEQDLRLISLSEQSADGQATEGGEIVVAVLNEVVQAWLDADEAIVAVPELPNLPFERSELGDSAEDPNAFAASLDRGRRIFHGQIANCVGCHGPEGNGSAVLLDYDDWSKEYSTRLGITPGDRDAMAPLREAGALPPRPISPRNLKQGVYRGGGDPETLFRRITEGIAGTPMPGVELTDRSGGTGLTADEIWDLVRYVRSLDEAES